MTSGSPAPDADARQRLLAVLAEVRPELFRYCARVTGSVFDGEDVVQDTLAKAHGALSGESPPLEPRAWLFRVAHNTAMDFLRRRERKLVELTAEIPDAADVGEGEADPELVDAALSVFVALPPAQRSALVLKDVLGQSLEQTASTMGTTVSAVKSALFRARANVAARVTRPPPPRELSALERANLRRYADLFNARDWDALRALLGEEAKLDLVSRDRRYVGPPAEYYSRYADAAPKERLRAEPGVVDGTPAIAVFRPEESPAPSYFILLEWEGSRVVLIRDFRYVPYIANGATFARAA